MAGGTSSPVVPPGRISPQGAGSGLDADTVDGGEGAHTEGGATAGTAYSESITFATAYSSTPVVAITHLGTGNKCLVRASSVSTTAATGQSFDAGDETGAPVVKHILAVGATV